MAKRDDVKNRNRERRKRLKMQGRICCWCSKVFHSDGRAVDACSDCSVALANNTSEIGMRPVDKNGF